MTKRRAYISLILIIIVGVTTLQLSKPTVSEAGTTTFSNATAIAIPNSGNASPYPSTIAVSGMTGLVMDVDVTLTGVTHAGGQDLDILLVGPDNTKVILMSDVCSTGAINATLTFNDGSGALSTNGTCNTGTYRPTNAGGGGDTWTGTPGGGTSTQLDDFNDINPNGNWRLFVVDDANPRSGSISGGWSITIRTAPVVVSISDVSLAEGNPPAGDTVFTFILTLNEPAPQNFTIRYTTGGGSATPLLDYDPRLPILSPGTVNFTAGSTTATATVNVNTELLVEANETFNVDFNNPSIPVQFLDDEATGTIINDDAAGAVITPAAIALAEGPPLTPLTATYTIALSSTPSNLLANITVAATPDTQCTITGGTPITYNILNATNPRTITVRAVDDLLYEGPHTCIITHRISASNVTEYPVGMVFGSVTVNITDNDTPPALSITDVTLAEGNAGTTNFVFTVSRPTISGTTASINFTTTNGTALAGEDYTTNSGTLNFAPADLSQTITVAVTGDTVFEPDETFTVDLSVPVGATIADGQGLGTITNDDLQPTISITDVSLAEGNAGTTNFVFTVSLSNASYQAITLDFASADGTASSASDYTALSGLLSFAPFTTASQTVTIAVTGDTAFELDETFFVNLTNAVNATFLDNQGLGTILNDDLQPTISITDVTLAEGNAGPTNFVFTVSLSNASYQTITADFTSADDTASAASDYTALSGPLSFAPFVTSQTVTIAVTGDTAFELDETFFVNLTNAVNATFLDNQGLGTIVNDDVQPTISIADVVQVEGNAGTTNFDFTVSLSNPSYQTITADFASADDSALSTSDYTALSGPLSFAPFVTSQTITIAVTGDTIFETDEAFFVNLTNAVNATFLDNQGLGMIINDDLQPVITITDVTLAEGNAGTTNFVFNVNFSNPSYQAVSVDFATADNSALSTSDYTALSGTLNFAPLAVTQTVTIAVTGDTIFEPDETFFVNLTNPINASILDNQGLGTILNDDTQPTISITDVALNEGNAGTTNFVFNVTFSNASYQAISVDFATANDTAQAGTDYTANSGTLNFAPLAVSQTITVVVTGDTVFEQNDTFFVNLSNPVNATIADNQGLGTIINDDTPPAITIDDISLNEGNAGTTDFIFTVSFSNASYQTITVDFASADGTAQAGSDYGAFSGTLTFAPLALRQTITIGVSGDTTFEPNETFFINLTNAVNATITDNQGLGTIINDDTPPAISINNVSLNEGNAGTTNFVFNVTFSNASYQAISVDFATANDTAQAGSDYIANSGTLNFAPFALSQTVTIVVSGDTTFEPNETFFVNLTNAVNATIADNQGLGTILNDDTQPGISINDVTASEATGGLTFTLSLTNASFETVTVNFATADGSASSLSDYTAASGTATFAPFAVTQTISVVVNNDPIFEPDETLVVDLSAAVNSTIGDNQGLGTITNDDGQPGLSINDVSANEDTGSLTFAVTLSNPSYQTITVDYASADGSALVGQDYAAAGGTLTFAPLEVSQPVTVTLTPENTFEPDETLFVNLSNSTNSTIADNQGLGTIVNDDGVPALSITDVSDIEPAIPLDYVFTVSLSNPSSTAIAVDFATADGTATVSGGDYNAASGALNFAPGDTSYTIAVTVNGDGLWEADETFTVVLSNVVNGTITDGEGLGTIVNDEAVSGFVAADAALGEESGTGFVTIVLNPPSGSIETVDYVISDITTTAGVDYSAVMTGTVIFPSGSTYQTIQIDVVNDDELEFYEHLQVTISNSSNPDISDDTGVVAILDDETPFTWEPACTFTDGRLNDDQRWDCAPPVAIYCTDAGIEIYQIDLNTSRGSLYISVTESDIEAIGVPASDPVVIAERPGVILYRLASGEFQVNAWSFDEHWPENTKPYAITWDACPPSNITHHTFSTQ